MKIIITSQGKGGVGKSTVAVFTSAYFLQQEKNLRCIDTDGVNHTLSGYKSLNSEVINIMTDDYESVDLSRIDELFANLIENQDKNETVIVDIGASSFLPIRQYIFNNQIHEMGLDITFILPICGGDNEDSTMSGVHDTITDFKDSCKYIIVQNLRDGELRFTGSKLEKNLKENSGYLGNVILPEIKGMLQKDYQVVTQNGLTYQDINTSPLLHILNRTRLQVFYRKFFEQLDLIMEQK